MLKLREYAGGTRTIQKTKEAVEPVVAIESAALITDLHQPGQMCSGRALTMTAIVPEYVGSAMRLSPAMTRVRSNGVVPQRAIQRRPGNRYSTASARTTKTWET